MNPEEIILNESKPVTKGQILYDFKGVEYLELFDLKM